MMLVKNCNHYEQKQRREKTERNHYFISLVHFVKYEYNSHS